VEVLGQLTGYVPRGTAKLLSPAMQSMCGGVIEGEGVIVGGWDDGDTQGDYGIRVWLNRVTLDRIRLEPDLVRRR
jgi:hypothetical protein